MHHLPKMIRLLNVNTFAFTEFHRGFVPTYAIASHRWSNQETSYEDISRKQNTHTYKRLQSFCAFFRKWNETAKVLSKECQDLRARQLDWLWIDTACIDKRSSAEVQEAITSMYVWYQQSLACFAYLADVSAASSESTSLMCNRVWFTRAWYGELQLRSLPVADAKPSIVKQI